MGKNRFELKNYMKTSNGFRCHRSISFQTGDTYSTGGIPLNSKTTMRFYTHYIALSGSNSNYGFMLDSTKDKLKIFYNTPGNELPDNTDISALKIDIICYGNSYIKPSGLT